MIDGQKERYDSGHRQNDKCHVPPGVPYKEQKVFHRFLFDLVRTVELSPMSNVIWISAETCIDQDYSEYLFLNHSFSSCAHFYCHPHALPTHSLTSVFLLWAAQSLQRSSSLRSVYLHNVITVYSHCFFHHTFNDICVSL